MTTRQFAAALGLAITLIWASEGFGEAVLALLVAAAAYAAVAFYEGDLDLAELQDRVRPDTRPAAPQPARRPGAPPRVR